MASLLKKGLKLLERLKPPRCCVGPFSFLNLHPGLIPSENPAELRQNAVGPQAHLHRCGCVCGGGGGCGAGGGGVGGASAESTASKNSF